MRFVGIAALAATFWLLVATVRLIVHAPAPVVERQVSGKFAGTATGACVEAALKTARFPPSDGFVTPWRVQLR